MDHTTSSDNLTLEEREILQYLLQHEQQNKLIESKNSSSEHTTEATLSFGQQRSWLAHELNKEQASPYDTLTINMRTRGTLNVGALKRSLAEIVRRHEVLRTTFMLKGDEPVQVVGAAGPALEQEDISSLPEAERECRLHELLQEAKDTLFDLAAGPLFQVRLIRLGKTEHVLIMMMHHIIFDGWSNNILTRELRLLYENFAEGRPSPLPELPIQYRDFSVWQRNWLQGDVLQKHLGYWTQQLAGLPVLELSSDRPRPLVQTFNGASETLLLSRQLSTAVVSLSKDRGATLFTTMLSVLGVLLYRYSRQEDIGIGTVVANRDREELRDQIGFFLNMLVMRLDLSGEPSFAELLECVKRTVQDGYAHQHLPFEKLVEEMQFERDRSRSPLFQVLFSLQDAPDTKPVQLKDLSLSPITITGHTTRFDLEVYVADRPSGLGLCFIYNTELFDASTIHRMLEHFRMLLESVVKDLDQPIDLLPMMSKQERQQITQGWNKTAEPCPGEETLAQLFEQQVDRNPQAIAVEYRDQVLTYKELDARSNQLAHYLKEQGIGADTLVGVFMERSLEMTIALVGIIKAGGAYVPLDPDDPGDRISYMLEDSRVPILLTQQHLLDKIPASNVSVVSLDHDWKTIAQKSNERLAQSARPEHLAYVIYTSGSTGKPKGVMNEHRGIVNRLQWMQERYSLNAEDRILQKTPYSFDVSVWEFFWPLLTGARLIVAEPGGHKDPAYLSNISAQKKISTLHFVPSMLKAYLDHSNINMTASIKRVICSGEILTPELQQQFFTASNAELHNLYGPTEAAVDVTSWACQRNDQRTTIPIGRPIANTHIYILDAHMQPVPVGVAGELHIGGVQVARGYLNQPELSAEKFITDPFSSEANTRLYKTGDLARYRPDGEIEYLGRIDHQIKLRGFRIELEEIEAVLSLHAAVKVAVVECRGNVNHEPRLIAYIVSGRDKSPTIKELRDLAQSKLPHYMVPNNFMVLDEIPLTANGKVNRQALPTPLDEPHLVKSYIAPRTELERQVVAIWQNVLSIKRVGVHDNFFDLGGHSLMATRVVSRIRESRALDLSVASLFENPTIATLTEYIETTQWAKQSLDAVQADQVDHRQVGEL